MMESQVFVALFGLIALAGFSQCGECPKLQGVANLDLDKLSGIWYSTWESSEPRMPCLSYEISKTKDGNANTKMIPYQMQLQGIWNDRSDSTKNFQMVAPLDLLDKAEWTIVYTDYVNLTAIYTCKADKNFKSITFWGRKPTISDDDFKMLKGIYDDLDLDTSDLQAIKRCDVLCIPLEWLGKNVLANGAKLIEMVKNAYNSWTHK